MISIAISDLKPALAGLAKVVSAKASLECLRCVRVDATPERVTLIGTDMEVFASVALPGAHTETTTSFLLPFDRLQSIARRLPPRSFLNLEEGKVAFDLGMGRVSENIEAPKLDEFPVEPEFDSNTVAMPESFARRFAEAMGCSSTDATRYVLNGIQLDVSDPASHYLIGTDGRHLFSANSFALPLSESAIIPKHNLLLWRGLADVPWALAGQKTSDAKKSETSLVRIEAGDWTLTMRTIDGTYPNWRQVVPKGGDIRTTVRLPEEHEFGKILTCLPGGDLRDSPVDLVIKNGAVAVKDTTGGEPIVLAGATAKGPDVTVRLNRDYLAKAFDYGLTNIWLIDPMSPLHFTRKGRQMVVMPLRVADYSQPGKPEVAPAAEPTPAEPAHSEPQPANQPAPIEPQQERKPMTEPIGQHTNGAATPHLNGAPRSTTPVIPAADKPAIEVAIEKLDAFKATFREALIGMTEIGTLLKQSVRDQKAGEKEIHQVRQTLRSLQSVRI
jgi:DNA polymerase III sliding clamp (beta) subunit (PCNA family)